jgi:hypothetical protein
VREQAPGSEELAGGFGALLLAFSSREPSCFSKLIMAAFAVARQTVCGRQRCLSSRPP